MDLEKILRDIEEQLEALPDESLPPIPPFNEDQSLSYANVSISNFFLAMFFQELVTSLAWHFSTTIKGSLVYPDPYKKGLREGLRDVDCLKYWYN